MQDLAVLTPSLIVCAAFLAGVIALLRHEMAPRRRGREDSSPAEDMPSEERISDQEELASRREEVTDQPAGRRSPGQAR